MTKKGIFWAFLTISILLSGTFRDISIGMAAEMGYVDYPGINVILGWLVFMVLHCYKKDREND